jgi:hypothetical protein
MTEVAASERSGVRLSTLGQATGVAAFAAQIADKFEAIVSIVGIAQTIISAWADAMEYLRNLVWDFLHVIRIDLSWVTVRLVPTLLILVSIITLSMRRGKTGLGLSLARRAPMAWSVVAAIMLFAMLAFEQSFVSAYGDKLPRGMTPAEASYAAEYFPKCRAYWNLSEDSPFDSICAVTSVESPVIRAVTAFGPFDWLIVIAYVAALGFVIARLQEEVLLAFVLAALLIAAGKITATGGA